MHSVLIGARGDGNCLAIETCFSNKGTPYDVSAEGKQTTFCVLGNDELAERIRLMTASNNTGASLVVIDGKHIAHCTLHTAWL